MVGLRQVSLLAVLTVPLATGCAGLHDARHSAMLKLGIETPAPATEFQCAWQNKLAQLPDPTKNGANVSGLPGQMFLFTAELKPATPSGDLTIIVTDETPRPHGMAKKTDEVWHFGKDKLEKMVATDEKFGKNFVLFVPWPDNWRDVSRVRLKARYDQTVNGQKTTLYAQDSLVTLDFVSGPGGAAMTMPFTGGGRGSVPDPMAVMNQMKTAGQAQAAANWPGTNPGGVPSATTPVGYTVPIQTPHQTQPPMWSPNIPAVAPGAGGMVVPAMLPPPN